MPYHYEVRDPKVVGREAYQTVVDLVSKPQTCRVVDTHTRELVAEMLHYHSISSRTQGDFLARSPAREAKRVCTTMSPEGMAIVVLAGATSAIVYGALNYNNLEPKFQRALDTARIPIRLPLLKAGIDGELRLAAGAEDFEASYRANMGPGRLGSFAAGGRYNTRTESPSVFFEFSLPFQ